MPQRPPLLPFDRESALAKVQAAEDAWNTRDRSTALDRARTGRRRESPTPFGILYSLTVI